MRWKTNNKTRKNAAGLNGIIGWESVIPPGKWLLVRGKWRERNTNKTPNQPGPTERHFMLQHQLQKNCFRDPLAKLSNSLMRQSFAVTCSHQRTEATVLDKVIYELFGFVSHFYKYAAPESMSDSVCVSREPEMTTISSLDNWGHAVLWRSITITLNWWSSNIRLNDAISVQMQLFKLAHPVIYKGNGGRKTRIVLKWKSALKTVWCKWNVH